MKKYKPLFIIPPLVILLDQITKFLIVLYIKIGDMISIVPGYFELVQVRNRGAAFGMLSAWKSDLRNWFFYGISLVALIALGAIYYKSKPKERRIHIPLALILGGALGNLLDRILRGEVIDFLKLHWQDKVADFTLLGKHFRFLLVWPSFNVADIAITCGAIYLAIVVLFFEAKKSQEEIK